MALRRAALIIGLCYELADPEITGLSVLPSVKYDVVRIYDFLVSKGITDITVLDDSTNVEAGLKENVYNALRDFVRKTNEERLDYALIYYAGHGAQIASQRKDESDEILNPYVPQPSLQEGKNEVIVPTDANLSTGGIIVDDDIRVLLTTAYPACHLTIWMDCCFSATMVDLKYEYRNPRTPLVNTKAQEIPNQTIISLSPCMDSQLSVESAPLSISDATQGFLNVTDPQNPGGYFTCTVLDLLTRDWSLNASIQKLYAAIRESMSILNTEKIDGGLSQFPQICSSRPLRENDPFILE